MVRFVKMVFLYSCLISSLVILLLTEIGVKYGFYGVVGGGFGFPFGESALLSGFSAALSY
jgi:hypothetical protein